MSENEILQQFRDMNRRQNRGWWIIMVMFIVIIGFEVTRVLVLDARVHALVIRLDTAQKKLAACSGGEYVPYYPNNVAGDPNHGD